MDSRHWLSRTTMNIMKWSILCFCPKRTVRSRTVQISILWCKRRLVVITKTVPQQLPRWDLAVPISSSWRCAIWPIRTADYCVMTFFGHCIVVIIFTCLYNRSPKYMCARLECTKNDNSYLFNKIVILSVFIIFFLFASTHIVQKTGFVLFTVITC